MKTHEIESLEAIGFSIEILTGPIGAVSEDWPHVAYTIRLLFKGKPVMDSPYSMGVGCVDVKKALIGSVNLMGLTVDEESIIYTWQSKPYANFPNKSLWASAAGKLAKQQKVVPSLSDVVYALLRDGEPFFNAQSFEDWASELVYDLDSRKAESIYRTCDATGRKMVSAIPAEALQKARNILANY